MLRADESFWCGAEEGAGYSACASTLFPGDRLQGAAHHVNTKHMRSSFAFWRARAKAWASSSKPQGIWDPSTVNDISKSNILTASEGKRNGPNQNAITKRDRMRMVQNQKRLKRTLCALRSYLRLKTRTRLKAGQCIERVMRTMQDPRRRKFWAHERTRLIWLMWSRYSKYKLAEREKLPSPTFSIQNDDWDRWVRMRIRMLGLKSHARVVAPKKYAPKILCAVGEGCREQDTISEQQKPCTEALRGKAFFTCTFFCLEILSQCFEHANCA